MKIDSKYDSYYVVGRIVPGIIASFPFLVIHFYFLRPILGKFWEEFLGIRILPDITIAMVLLLILVFLSRFIGKELFEKRMFGGSLSWFIADYLSHTDSRFSPEYKSKIHEKIRADFKFDLSIFSEEAQGKKYRRQPIAEVVGLIRKRVGKGELVGQHNTEYGFFRNLAGGAVVAIMMSVINMIIFGMWHLKSPFIISLILFLFYLVYLLFAKWIIKKMGGYYTNTVFKEYLSF